MVYNYEKTRENNEKTRGGAREKRGENEGGGGAPGERGGNSRRKTRDPRTREPRKRETRGKENHGPVRGSGRFGLGFRVGLRAWDFPTGRVLIQRLKSTRTRPSWMLDAKSRCTSPVSRVLSRRVSSSFFNVAFVVFFGGQRRRPSTLETSQPG